MGLGYFLNINNWGGGWKKWVGLKIQRMIFGGKNLYSCTFISYLFTKSNQDIV